MNRKLGAAASRRVFMMTGEDYFYISSQLVREVASLGGDVEGLVPAERATRSCRRSSRRRSPDPWALGSTGCPTRRVPRWYQPGMKLAHRLKAIKPSPTLALNAKAKALAAQGVDVVGFAAGEPDFDTPEFIKDAAVEALAQGFTKYTATARHPRAARGHLREARDGQPARRSRPSRCW